MLNQRNRLVQSGNVSEALETRAMLAFGSVDFDGNVPQKFKTAVNKAKDWWNGQSFEFKDLDFKVSYRDIQAPNFPGGGLPEGSLMAGKKSRSRVYIDTGDGVHQTNSTLAWKAVAHELGHVLGLGHNNVSGTLMFPALLGTTEMKLLGSEIDKLEE